MSDDKKLTEEIEALAQIERTYRDMIVCLAADHGMTIEELAKRIASHQRGKDDTRH